MSNDHLIPLHGEWQLWRCGLVRGAGFEARGVLELAAPNAAQASTALLRLEEQFAEAIAKARSGIWKMRGNDEFMRARSKALNKLGKGKPPTNINDLGDAIGLANAVVELARELERAEAAVARAFDDDAKDISRALANVAADPRFLEAMLWQNRDASKRLQSVRDGGTRPNNRLRQSQGLVASYLQRYCVKNDTIGFFGPVGWAMIGKGTTRVRAGSEFLDLRRVFFEHWPIEALALALSEDVELLQDLCPRLLPFVRIEEDGEIVYGAGKRARVPGAIEALLRACDGQSRARDIASALIDSEREFEEMDDVFEELDALVEKRLVSWRVEIPSGIMDPSNALSEVLTGLPASAARERGLAALAALERARARLEASVGTPDLVRRDLQALEDCLAEHIEMPTARGAGKMYAAKTPVYEDCRRSMELVLGDSYGRVVAAPLVLILASARWFTHEVARRYRSEANRVFDNVVGSDTTQVDYAVFWKSFRETLPTLSAAPMPLVAEVQMELRRRWCKVLGLEEGRRRPLAVSSKEIAEFVHNTFHAQAPGWPSARHMSPDIMLCAENPAAIETGRFSAVLGEIHIGNTLPLPWSLQMHQDPESVIRWKDADLSEPLVCPVQASEFVTRVDRVSYSDNDLSLEVGMDRSWRRDTRILRVADLVVAKTTKGLRIRHIGRDLDLDIIAFIDQYLTFASSSNFSWAPSWKFVPRVTVDDMVIVRATWRFEADEFPSIPLPWGPSQFHSFRRWTLTHSIPRFVFLKTPEEPKPVFLDVDSPHLVGRALTILKRASRATISEMLPAFDNLWLPDAQGRKYTSEIRCVVVDPMHWERYSPGSL